MIEKLDQFYIYICLYLNYHKLRIYSCLFPLYSLTNSINFNERINIQCWIIALSQHQYIQIIFRFFIKIEDYLICFKLIISYSLSFFKKPLFTDQFSILEVQFSKNNNLYIVLQICKSDLDKYCKAQKEKRLDQKTAIKIFKQILTGYAYLLSKGIVHRDLKQINILIDENKTVKITDFGLSKQINAKNFKNQMLQTVCGTKNYMAPQMKIEGKQYTSKSQIWSLGVILYRIIRGQRPWNNKTNNITQQIVKNAILELQNIQISNQTKYIIERMLQVQQQDRISWKQLFQHFRIHHSLVFQQQEQCQPNEKSNVQMQGNKLIQKLKNSNNTNDKSKKQTEKRKNDPKSKNQQFNQFQQQVSQRQKQISRQRAKTVQKNKNDSLQQQKQKKIIIMLDQQSLKTIILSKVERTFLKQIAAEIRRQLQRSFINQMKSRERKYVQLIIELQKEQIQKTVRSLLYK